MGWAVSVGLMNGVSETALAPGGPVNRAQLASVALRLQEL